MIRIVSLFGMFVAIILSNLGSIAQSSKLSKVFSFSSPEEQGISSDTLNTLMSYIKETNQNIHHLTVIRNNHTVLDSDFYPYSSEFVHDVASVTKSITALLIGIAKDKGFIKSEEQTVIEFFPEITNSDSILKFLKIKHLVSMTSGFSCSSTDGEMALSNMRKSDDWVRFVFKLPLIARPGEVFSYCSCNFYLLAEIIYRTSHLTPHEFAKKYLFGPLQINGSVWLSNYKKINHGWGDMFLYPADMAKIGKLMMDKGRWNNKQIVSDKWIHKSLKTVKMVDNNKGYTYGWWTNDRVGFCEAAGRGRQTISIIPSKNMIVVMLGGEFDAGAIGKYIFQSIQSAEALPENKSAFAKLTNSIKGAIATPENEEVMPTNDSLIKTLHGRTIQFERNITEIDSMRFRFSPNLSDTVFFYRNKSIECYPFKFSSNHYSISVDPILKLPVALNAKSEGNKLVLHYNQLCMINNFYFRFIVNKNDIVTVLEETSNNIKINIKSSLR